MKLVFGGHGPGQQHRSVVAVAERHVVVLGHLIQEALPVVSRLVGFLGYHRRLRLFYLEVAGNTGWSTFVLFALAGTKKPALGELIGGF